jgi:hypothetical protein
MSGPSEHRGGKRRRRDNLPTVLVRLFGDDRICSLHAALRRLLADAAPRLETLRRGDTPEYRRLLRRTLVVSVAPGPAWKDASPLPSDTPLANHCNPTDGVKRAMAAVRERPGAGANVLSFGDTPQLLRAHQSANGPPPPAGAPAAPEWTRTNLSSQALQVRHRVRPRSCGVCGVP